MTRAYWGQAQRILPGKDVLEGKPSFLSDLCTTFPQDRVEQLCSSEGKIAPESMVALPQDWCSNTRKDNQAHPPSARLRKMFPTSKAIWKMDLGKKIQTDN